MWMVTLLAAAVAFAPPLRTTRGVAVPPTPQAVPPPVVLGTEGSERILAKREPAIVAGLGGHDIVIAHHPESQLAG